MNYTMYIFGLILLPVIVSSSPFGEISIPQTTVVGFLKSELKYTKKAMLTTILETSIVKDENDYQDCICTPFHKCKTYKAAPDCKKLIDIRINAAPCQSYFDVCCNDTKITSTEKYKQSSPYITDSDRDCDDPEDYSKKPNIYHKDITKKPSDGYNVENTDKPSQDHKRDHTKDPYITHSLNDTEKSSDGHKGDNTKGPYVTHNVEDPQKSSEGHKGDHAQDLDDSYEVTEKSITHENSTTEPDKTSYDHQENHKCGVWNKYGVGFRIENSIGSESQFGEFPSMVAIFNEELSEDSEKKLVYLCGGSLIKKDVILTGSANCVNWEKISTLVVRAGEWDLKTGKEILNHQDRRVTKVVSHPDHTIRMFVALIFTEHSFSLQDNIQLTCLPSKEDIIIKDTCYSIGWGKTVSYNNYTIFKKTESGKTKETGIYKVSILKKVELPIVSRDTCRNALNVSRGPNFEFKDRFICAGGQEGKDPCKGDDKGSPLMCPYKDEPGRLVQVGIGTWDVHCGSKDLLATYVDVAGIMDWINNEIKTYRRY